MTNITSKTLKDYSISGTFRNNCSIKPHGDTTDSKSIALDVVFENVALVDVLTKALRPTTITWQNGPGRSKWSQWTNGQTVTIDFKSPAKRVLTREERIDEYVAKGYARDVSTYAVDYPEEFAKIVNANVKLPEPTTDETNDDN